MAMATASNGSIVWYVQSGTDLRMQLLQNQSKDQH